MNKICYCFLIVVMISCNSKKDNYLISGDSAGLLKIGMDINDAQKLFPDCKFETVDLYTFGLDGGDSGILVKKQNEKIVVYWDYGKQNKINGILCLSSKYHTINGIKPKMTVGELKKIEPQATIQINLISQEHEFITLENEGVSLEFASAENNRVGKYKNIDPEESTTEMRTNARINFIRLLNK